MNDSWFARLERVDTSYLLLATLAGTALAASILYQIGLIGWALRAIGLVVRECIRRGFLLWERLLAWASWPRFLAIVVGFLVAGGMAGGPWPDLRVLCGLVPLFMGVITCLAYMFIDLERNEVERGHKAIHNPLKGQVLAMNLERYGEQVRIPLLISATVALIGGFALLNQGLYETIGRDWYRIADERREPIYVDFLAYALTKILGIVDVLDLFKSHHILGAAFVRQAAWPAGVLLAAFKGFFTLVLLHQIFASLRQGKLLAETITDFWSPHEPIHERARNALPVYGTLAISPLLGSLRLVPSLTKEQRDQLPLILETIGPSIIPALVRHLHDPHEHVRAVVAAALGELRALETVPLLAELVRDPSEVVRQSVVEALGVLGSPGQGSARYPAWSGPRPRQAGPDDHVVFRVENARHGDATLRPHRAGRGDAGVRPGRRFGRGADPGGPGAGPDRVARRGPGPGTDRDVEGGRRNCSLPGRPCPRPGRRGSRGDGGRTGRATQ